MGLADRLAAQRAHIAELEAAMWADGFDATVLPAYQQAYRQLETLLREDSSPRRHRFVVVIPTADNPQQLRGCLDSLLEHLEAYGYGGKAGDALRMVSVLLADDSEQGAAIAHNRALAEAFSRAGLRVEYFGIDAQQALIARLDDIDLRGIIGAHAPGGFAHKGQGIMRNIAYLRLAELPRDLPGERLLFYTVDADQQFRVKVASAGGGFTVDAVNFFHQLDRLFDSGAVQVLTGKVVGDPPVSPAVMASRFLDDLLALLDGMRTCEPQAAYRQPQVDTRGSGEASYHDMADLFGFTAADDAHRYRCTIAGAPSNADCLSEFARRVNGFFHGEHPTRVTWYRHQPLDDSVQHARTIYTGNYVFTPQALDWFIPFAPLRLRMSGPTMGRLLRERLGDAFVSANVPMLHCRTLTTTGASEYRPGVVASRRAVDLSDEFERQFFGDVMLFTVERLTQIGYPLASLAPARIGAVLDDVHDQMLARYQARQQAVRVRLDRLRTLLDEPRHWWNRLPALAAARDALGAFADNVDRNFGAASGGYGRIGADGAWSHWRARQLAAITGLHADRAAWRRALAVLRDSGN